MSGEESSPGWLRERAETFIGLVRERGMVMTVDAAEGLIADRTKSVARRLGVAPTSARAYLDDWVLAGLADAVVATVDDEQPGVDPLEAARTVGVGVADLGRLVAGLAESVLIYTGSPALDADDRGLRLEELVRSISVCGLLQSEFVSGEVAVPPSLLARIARSLDTAASHASLPELASALRDDAIRARTCGTSIDLGPRGVPPRGV